MDHKVKILGGSGGFGIQLSKYVDEPVDGNPLWTAKFLALHQDKCVLVHRDFAKAGADIITTSTYQASVDGYKKYLDLERNYALQVIKDSVRLVREGIKKAEEETGKKYSVLVAGAVGPYGASLHDGSEYSGSYCQTVTEEEMIAWHRPRISALVEAGVDVLAIETVPCIREALAVLKLLKEFPSVKAWLSFSIKDTKSISSGENFCEAAVQIWNSSDQLIAVGANCLNPFIVVDLFKPFLAKHPNIPAIVYANSGESYDTINERWLAKDKPLNIEDCVPEWLNLGISFVGGCCRTNGTDVFNISRKVKEWESRRANIL